MSFLAQSKIAQDPWVQERVTACAASVGVSNPSYWASSNAWYFAGLPGWAEAYGSASGEFPGADESAVTDAMILTAVESLRAAQPSSPAQ